MKRKTEIKILISSVFVLIINLSFSMASFSNYAILFKLLNLGEILNG